VAMSQLGEEEKWLVDGTKWFTGRTHGSMFLRRPRPDQPPPQQSSTALALICICIIIATTIAGVIVVNKWLLGHYTVVEQHTGPKNVDEPASSFVLCGHESSICVPRSECSFQATGALQTRSEECMVVV
jgi:hypothetical protein